MQLSLKYIVLALLGLGVVFTLQAEPAFTYGYAPRKLGSADNYGYALWTRSLGEININGYVVPLRLYFTTDPRPVITPSPLGRGWVMPFFASALVEVDQDSLRWHRPDGRIFYFNIERAGAAATDKKEKNIVVYNSSAGAWRAAKNLKTRRYVLTHIESGAELVYEDGLLVRFCLVRWSDTVEQYAISYNRFRCVTRLSVVKSGKALVEFVYEDERRAKELKLTEDTGLGKSLSFEYVNAELTKFPEGPYLAKVVGAKSGLLNFSYRSDGSVNEAQFECLTEAGDMWRCLWDVNSGFLKSDQDANYEIENPSLVNSGHSILPDKKIASEGYNWHPNQAKITRIARNGKSEFSYYDRAKGINTKINSEGLTTRTYYFLASGPMMNKVRKIEEIKNGKTSIVLRNAYDELGRVIRSIDSTGSIEIREYLDNGGLVRVIKDGRVAQEIRYVGGKMVSRLEYREGIIKETTWGENGLSGVSINEGGVVRPDVSVTYDDQGRRKRHVVEGTKRVSEYKYTDSGYTESIFRNGVLWARDYYDLNSKRYKSIYENGQEAAWFTGNGEILLLMKSKQGKLSSASKIVNNQYVKSAGDRDKIMDIVNSFLVKSPGCQKSVADFVANCITK